MAPDLVIGVGEIGSNIFNLLKLGMENVLAYDQSIDKFQMSHSELNDRNVNVIHICVPYSQDFVRCVLDYVENFPCQEIVIHSTVKPGTTKNLQEKVDVPVIYSPVRGVHVRMLEDMKRYTKFWASAKKQESLLFPNELKACGVKQKEWESTTQLELAKILMDTTYYGWLILYAQRVKIICDKYGVSEPQLWEFTHEIQEFLGNRPTMFPGTGIGGHCVMQNLDLLNDDFVDVVFTHDKIYRRHLTEKRK